MKKEKIARTAAVVVCTLFIAGLSVQQATANLAGCSNCIEASDIAAGAVRASELNDDLNDTITKNDIGSGAVGKSELGSNSVGLSELSAAAQPVAGEVNMSQGAVLNTTSGTAVDIDSLVITAPAAGSVVIQITGEWWIDHASGGEGDIALAHFGLCTAADVLSQASCGRDYAEGWHLDENTDSNSTDNTKSLVLTRVLPVTAGANTFYVNANTDEGTLRVFDLFASVIFTPAGTLTLS